MFGSVLYYLILATAFNQRGLDMGNRIGAVLLFMFARSAVIFGALST